jgi:hypothetical protein
LEIPAHGGQMSTGDLTPEPTNRNRWRPPEIHLRLLAG